MRSSKGSKKDFYRYVQSEIDDDYLEPLESEILSTNDTTQTAPSEGKRCHCKSNSRCYHKRICLSEKPDKNIIYSKFSGQYSSRYSYAPMTPKKPELANPKAVFIPPKTHKFTDKMMITCISNLGTDAKNCYYGLQEFTIIKDQALLERFKDMFKALETIHVLFLSMACAPESDKIEAVYLWQMNEKCPYVQREENQQSIVVDVKSNLANTRYFPSILLLAKITPETEEEILEAKILGDNKLLIQSRISSELVYKIFNVTSFETSARVNPLHQNILANSLYTWKLKVNPSPSDKEENTIQVSVWKKCSLEELDQDTPTDENKVHERIYNSTTTSDIALTFVEYSFYGWTVLLDRKSSTFIVWKEHTFDIFSFTEMMGSIHTFEVIKQTFCVLINTKGQVFTFNIHELPSIKVQATAHILPLSKGSPPKIQIFSEKYNLRAVELAYFWEGKFYCVNLMESELATVLLDLEDATLPQDFKSWRFTEEEVQRLLFYVKNNVLNIYDLKKSRHQTQKLLFEGSQQKSRDWQICTESPTNIYVHTVDGPEILVREINYKGEVDNFFNNKNEIQYFDGESPINNKAGQNIVQIETPSHGNSSVLLRMKEPFYEDALHYMSYDGPLSYIPPRKELGEMPEKRERCPYHKLVDRMEIIQKRAERYQYDEKFAEDAEQMQKDIQNLIAKNVDEEQTIDFRKYLNLYKEIKQVQKSIKAAKVRQNTRPKNDFIS